MLEQMPSVDTLPVSQTSLTGNLEPGVGDNRTPDDNDNATVGPLVSLLKDVATDWTLPVVPLHSSTDQTSIGRFCINLNAHRQPADPDLVSVVYGLRSM